MANTGPIRISRFLSDDELFYDSEGNPLVNGLFGVAKEDAADPEFNPLTRFLRLIADLVPSNELQRELVGEIRSLPLFSQWALLELLQHEVLLLSSEDTTAAFYVFGLPASWLPLFVLHARRSQRFT